jgi:hypothetical protein
MVERVVFEVNEDGVPAQLQLQLLRASAFFSLAAAACRSSTRSTESAATAGRPSLCTPHGRAGAHPSCPVRSRSEGVRPHNVVFLSIFPVRKTFSGMAGHASVGEFFSPQEAIIGHFVIVALAAQVDMRLRR